jgi:hypothetical protein
MIAARWIVIVGFLAAVAALDSVLHASQAGSTRLAERPGDINVNPYGDPIWQEHAKPPRSRVQRHVKRSASKTSRHVRHALAKHGRHAKLTRSASRPKGPNPVGKPLVIIPPAARLR